MSVGINTLVRLVLLICSATSLALGDKSYPGNDLVALCRGKPIKLTTISQLRSLVTKLDDDLGGGCDEQTRSALMDLEAVVTENKLKECSIEAYENYRTFYKKYLDTSSKERKAKKLPSSLRHFAIAYGIHVSGLCRMNMVNVLLKESTQHVTLKDFERPEIKVAIAANGSIAQALGDNGGKPDEMLLPSDFFDLVNAPTVGGPKISFQVDATPVFIRIQTICRRRFEPIYRNLMIPVAKMANLGFDHRKNLMKDNIKQAMADKATSDLIGKWTRIAFLCEIMHSVRLIEEEVDAKRAEGNDATQVHVVSKDIACHCPNPIGRDLLESVEASVEDIEQVDFKPNLHVPVRDDDEIAGTLGRSLAVKMVFTSFDENANVRLRMTRRILGNIQKLLKSGKYVKLAKEARKMVKNAMECKSKEEERHKDVRRELIVSLNDMISRDQNSDSAVAVVSKELQTASHMTVIGVLAAIILIVILVVATHSG